MLRKERMNLFLLKLLNLSFLNKKKFENVNKNTFSFKIKNILKFENEEIDEDTFRKNILSKSYRDKMSQSVKKKINKQRHSKLTEEQLEEKRERNRNYIKNTGIFLIKFRVEKKNCNN